MKQRMYSHFTFVFFGFFTNGHQTRFGVNEDFLKIYESIMYFSIGPAFIHQLCHLVFCYVSILFSLYYHIKTMFGGTNGK
jgi:hypothetical protein